LGNILTFGAVVSGGLLGNCQGCWYGTAILDHRRFVEPGAAPSGKDFSTAYLGHITAPAAISTLALSLQCAKEARSPILWRARVDDPGDLNEGFHQFSVEQGGCSLSAVVLKDLPV
jgi:hypothetical protein